MAKKQTRRSISVSRTTYERLKAFCESNNISMSQFVETRVGDFLGGDAPTTVDLTRPPAPRPAQPAPVRPAMPLTPKTETAAGACSPAGADDVGRCPLCGRAAPAGDQAEAGAARAQAGREAPGPDLHVLVERVCGATALSGRGA